MLISGGHISNRSISINKVTIILKAWKVSKLKATHNGAISVSYLPPCPTPSRAEASLLIAVISVEPAVQRFPCESAWKWGVWVVINSESSELKQKVRGNIPPNASEVTSQKYDKIAKTWYINTFSSKRWSKCLAFTRKPLNCRLNRNNCYSDFLVLDRSSPYVWEEARTTMVANISTLCETQAVFLEEV